MRIVYLTDLWYIFLVLNGKQNENTPLKASDGGFKEGYLVIFLRNRVSKTIAK